ncbi:MAG: hypothetical protein C0516_01070 [Gemmatimonas sp.]|jgi:hypothetical protein|nr:hypothetical protein [Gemmatimonas sp.]MBL0889661.1 hypothetical protein [Gemmatimonadaceae bacterium]
MSINGINNSPLLPNLGATRSDAARSGAANGQGLDRAALATQQGLARANAQANANALKPQTPIAGQQATQSPVSAEAPAGTDPAFWSVLTTEERNFFAKTASMGPLTYGRYKAATAEPPAPPAARGIRLDVRA